VGPLWIDTMAIYLDPQLLLYSAIQYMTSTTIDENWWFREKVSAADISSICSEAGLMAVRENRYVILPKDFDSAYKKAVNNREKELAFYTM
jgi:ATP-dependent 26S proteasome regulatory subunit